MTVTKLFGILALLGAFAASTGCENTVRGVGQDMEDTGEALQNQDGD